MHNVDSQLGRTAVIVAVAVALLVGLVVATNGGSSSSGGSGATATPQPTAIPRAASSSPIHVAVTASVRRLSSRRYAFIYTLHNVGRVPVGGFQLNGGRANLFAVSRPVGWTVFGAGVCAGNYPNVLAYWSTGSRPLKPGSLARFSFQVSTSGTTRLTYSLSQKSSVVFGAVVGPQPSRLPALGRC